MTEHQDLNVDTATEQVRVFVSYRREDTKHVAGRLRDRIVARFGVNSVFVDVESIEPGLDYVDAIDRAVGSCAVMLVLIGDRWLQASDSQGLRRIDDAADRLRLEVEAGLRKQTRVIPVLVDSASMPKSGDLPSSLVPLSRHHATRLRHESFQSDADHLLAVVERVVTGTGPPPPREDGWDALRWLSFGLLVTFIVAQFSSRSGVQDFVAASRGMPPEGPWGSLVWMLPALPVIVASWLVAGRRRLGVAFGCITGAAMWVSVSLLYVVDKQQDSATSAHLLLLALLFGSLASLLVSVPQMRQRVGLNRWDRALPACLLLAAAIALRLHSEQIASVIMSTASDPTNWAAELSKPRFWISALMPLLICLPGALLLCNKIQTQTLVTLACLQIFYPIALSSMRFVITSQASAPVVVVDDLVFLAGCLSMLAAVLVGQRRSTHPT